jgi:PAS domain S-box-containing protein
MVEHLPTGAVFREGDSLLLNEAAEEITGYLRSDLSTVDDWFKKLYGGRHEERRRVYEESRNSGFPVRRTLSITRRDGQKRWVEFAAYAYEKGEVWLLHDITGLKKTEEELRGYQAQLRSLASELSLAEDRERRRISMELHDGLGQALSMAHVKLEMLGAVERNAESAEMLEEARRLIDQAISDTRLLTFELSSPILHQVGLVPALQQLCEDMAQQYGGRFYVEEDERPKPLSSERRMVLFRCVRELLINVAKHADAGEAKVSVTTDAHRLQIGVEDNGIGFATSQIGRSITPSGGFGLFNIHEYLSHLGGSMQIQSVPGQGTRVLVTAPLQTDQCATPPTDGSETNG